MKAQLTIEYLIILVIMLLLFSSITMDLVNTSEKDAMALQTAEMVGSAKMILSDAFNIISLQGIGAKKTVNLRAPPDCSYTQATPNTISLQCDLASPSYNAGYNGMLVTPANPPAGVSCVIVNAVINSGTLGTVTISKA